MTNRTLASTLAKKQFWHFQVITFKIRNYLRYLSFYSENERISGSFLLLLEPVEICVRIKRCNDCKFNSLFIECLWAFYKCTCLNMSTWTKLLIECVTMLQSTVCPDTKRPQYNNFNETKQQHQQQTVCFEFFACSCYYCWISPFDILL